MNVLNNYYTQIVKQDFLNKFNYKNVSQIPKIKKIALNFNCKNFNTKKLALTMLTLELITTKKGKLTVAKKAVVNLKLRKGHPVGCKIILEKKKMNAFLFNLLNKIFPQLKNFKGFKTKQNNKNDVSFSLQDLTNFYELNSNFYVFTDLPTLNVTLIYNTQNGLELKFFNNALKIPLFFK